MSAAAAWKSPLRSFFLVSRRPAAGPAPWPHAEDEQHLVVAAGGRACLSRYRYGANQGRELAGRQRSALDAQQTAAIFRGVDIFFRSFCPAPDAAGSGRWAAALTDANGHVYAFEGPLCAAAGSDSVQLSDLVRDTLGWQKLFALDGCPDALTRLQMFYRRTGRTARGGACLYREWLTLDRTAETVELVCQMNKAIRVMHQYTIPGHVSTFMDGLCRASLTRATGSPPDAMPQTRQTLRYAFTLASRHSGRQALAGAFDRDSLPEGWPGFVQGLRGLLPEWGFGEMLDPARYARPCRRQSDYIYYDVCFEEGGRTYCYLARSDEYQPGELVVVPTGRDDREAVARIEALGYYQAENAPFPPARTKYILRRYAPEPPAEQDDAPQAGGAAQP